MNPAIESLLSSLNAFDYLVIVIVTISGMYGLLRGFIKEAVTLTAWFLAVWAAYVYSNELSHYLSEHIAMQSLRVAIVVIGIFAVVLSLSAILRRIIRYIIDHAGLGGLDHVLGMGFGLLRGVVLAMLLILLLDLFGFSADAWWGKSVTIVKLSKWMDVIPSHVPSTVLNMYKDAKQVASF